VVSRKDESDYADEEIARRRDEVIRRMANTPPQPRVSHPSTSRPEKERSTVSGRKVQKKGGRVRAPPGRGS
jgi:hypothetical protein